MREIAHELLCKQDISLLLKKLYIKALVKTDEFRLKVMFEAVLLLLDKKWITPDICVKFISFASSNSNTEVLETTLILLQNPALTEKILFVLSNFNLFKSIFLLLEQIGVNENFTKENRGILCY